MNLEFIRSLYTKQCLLLLLSTINIPVDLYLQNHISIFFNYSGKYFYLVNIFSLSLSTHNAPRTSHSSLNFLHFFFGSCSTFFCFPHNLLNLFILSFLTRINFVRWLSMFHFFPHWLEPSDFNFIVLKIPFELFISCTVLS